MAVTTSEWTFRNSSRGSPSDDLCHTATLTTTWLDQELITSCEVSVYCSTTGLDLKSPNKGGKGSNARKRTFSTWSPLHPLLCHQGCSREAQTAGEKLVRISHLTNKGSLTHWDEQHAVNEFAETGFYNPLVAVLCSQVLSEETSGYITVDCHCARLHWSPPISSKMNTVWERSGGRPNTPRVDGCFIHRALSWIHQTQLRHKYVLLSQGFFFLLLGPDLSPAESLVWSHLLWVHNSKWKQKPFFFFFLKH